MPWQPDLRAVNVSSDPQGAALSAAAVPAVLAAVPAVFAPVAHVFAPVAPVLDPIGWADVVPAVPSILAAIPHVFTPIGPVLATVASILPPVADVFGPIPRPIGRLRGDGNRSGGQCQYECCGWNGLRQRMHEPPFTQALS